MESVTQLMNESMECDDRIINEISRISCAFDAHSRMEKLYRVHFVQRRFVLEQEQREMSEGEEKCSISQKKKAEKETKKKSSELMGGLLADLLAGSFVG